MDTEGIVRATHLITPLNTPECLEASSRVPQIQSTSRDSHEKYLRSSWEPSHIPIEEPERRAASYVVDAFNQVLDMQEFSSKNSVLQ